MRHRWPALRCSVLHKSSVSALVAIIIAIFTRGAVGIIPGPCVTNDNSIEPRCCPTPDIVGAGPCGFSLSFPRGHCVQVSSINSRCMPSSSYSVYERDARKDWPHFFTHLCKCEGNYAGYDCGECKFGYRGDDCSERTTTRRRSISSFSTVEREDYLNAIKMAKHASYSRYRAISYDGSSIYSPRVVPVKLYDLFAWLHFYAGRDNDKVGEGKRDARDYAHESGGFPTWHRLYLLWFEREIKILTGNEDFALAYWDWTKEDDREIALTDEWFGGIGPYGKVTGYFGSTSDWPIVCSIAADKKERCDPSRDRNGQLHRCPSPNECRKNNTRWPSQEDVNRPVAIEAYDTSPYSRNSKDSFRNLLEGFEHDGCSAGDTLCSGGIRRKLHNTVHVILGIGDFGTQISHEGTMGNVPIASNDPIFSSHHAMVDYIFEKWLLRNPSSLYKPYNSSNSVYQGHREGDCLVPFLPLHTNADMFKPASEFGYEYVSGAISAGPTGILVLGLVLTLSTFM